MIRVRHSDHHIILMVSDIQWFDYHPKKSSLVHGYSAEQESQGCSPRQLCSASRRQYLVGPAVRMDPGLGRQHRSLEDHSVRLVSHLMAQTAYQMTLYKLV